LFVGEALSGASQTFAAFVAMRPVASFTAAETKKISDLLRARLEERGVPLMWMSSSCSTHSVPAVSKMRFYAGSSKGLAATDRVMATAREAIDRARHVGHGG